MVGSLFGVPVSELYTNGGFPNSLVNLLEYIEENALDIPQIFNVSSDDRELVSPLRMLDDGEEITFGAPKLAIGILKHFLSKLPQSLIPGSLYPVLLSIYEKVEDIQVRVGYYKAIVDSLSSGNKILLCKLLDLFSAFLKYDKSNFLSIAYFSQEFSDVVLRAEVNANNNKNININITKELLEYSDCIACEVEVESDLAAIGIANWKFQGGENELSFNAGDYIFGILLPPDLLGWAEGELIGGKGGNNYGYFPSSYVTFIHALKPSSFMPSSRGGGGARGGGARAGGGGGGDMSRKQFLAELDELKKQSQSEAALTQSLVSTIQSLTSQLHQYKSTFISLVPSADFSSSSSSSSASSSSSSNSSVSADEVHSLYAEFNQMKSDVEAIESSNEELNIQFNELSSLLTSANSSISSLKQENSVLRSSLKSLASTFESISKSPITVSVPPSSNNNNNINVNNSNSNITVNNNSGGSGGGSIDGGGDDSSPLGSLPKANIPIVRPISKPKPLSRSGTPTRLPPSPNMNN